MSVASTAVNGTVSWKSSDLDVISVTRTIVATTRVASSMAEWSPMGTPSAAHWRGRPSPPGIS